MLTPELVERQRGEIVTCGRKEADPFVFAPCPPASATNVKGRRWPKTGRGADTRM